MMSNCYQSVASIHAGIPIRYRFRLRFLKIPAAESHFPTVSPNPPTAFAFVIALTGESELISVAGQ